MHPAFHRPGENYLRRYRIIRNPSVSLRYRFAPVLMRGTAITQARNRIPYNGKTLDRRHNVGVGTSPSPRMGRGGEGVGSAAAYASPGLKPWRRAARAATKSPLGTGPSRSPSSLPSPSAPLRLLFRPLFVISFSASLRLCGDRPPSSPTPAPTPGRRSGRLGVRGRPRGGSGCRASASPAPPPRRGARSDSRRRRGSCRA